MLASFYSRQTSRQLVLISSRVTLSTLPYPKSSETQAAPDGTPINYPTTKSKIESLDPVLPNTKVSNTLVLPGVPLTPTPPPLAYEAQQTPKEEEPERIPSTRFSAFLRSIRSGLPFFPSGKNRPSTVNIATTREHFLPV